MNITATAFKFATPFKYINLRWGLCTRSSSLTWDMTAVIICLLHRSPRLSSLLKFSYVTSSKGLTSVVDRDHGRELAVNNELF